MASNKKYNFASFFGNNPDVSLKERNRVMGEVKKIGILSFEIDKNKKGWTAQCNEVKEIITGNTNPNPTRIEIESQIRDAIFAAFNVRLEKKVKAKAQQFEYSFS